MSTSGDVSLDMEDATDFLYCKAGSDTGGIVLDIGLNGITSFYMTYTCDYASLEGDTLSYSLLDEDGNEVLDETRIVDPGGPLNVEYSDTEDKVRTLRIEFSSDDGGDFSLTSLTVYWSC